MFGAMGLFLSSAVRQLENFAGVMNFVIFPMFFASSALYPLWRLRESSEPLSRIAMASPFTHAVELIRFALYGKLAPVSLGVVVGCTLVFGALALWAYDPEKGSLGGGPAVPGSVNLRLRPQRNCYLTLRVRARIVRPNPGKKRRGVRCPSSSMS
jgi:hypothetical protein